MRLLTSYEITKMTKPELHTLLRSIAATLPALAYGSEELRVAHANLEVLRRALAPRPPRPI